MAPTESTDERDGKRLRRTYRLAYSAIAALAGVLFANALVFARDVSVEAGAKHSAIERRWRPPAVDFCTRIQTRLHGDRAFVEGRVANGAPFAVHKVRVCIKGECDYTTPSTLQPGSQATFRVPAKLERYMSGPDYRITWEVMPGGRE
jgi:hypothetical protein